MFKPIKKEFCIFDLILPSLMPLIHLETAIRAPIEKCFELSLSVEVHEQSTAKTNEKAIAGRLSGVFELGDTVTWEATHFMIRQQLTVEITKLERPYFFEDRMIRGAFKSMRHEHHFRQAGEKTVMKDIFHYETPFGIIGQLFSFFVLKNYMKRFLIKRNEMIRTLAEAGRQIE